MVDHPQSTASRPFLSVIIPALTVDRELRRCIDSVALVLGEAVSHEIVVAVPARLVQPATAELPQVRVVAETRRGVYAAMNDAIRASSGEYLYFLGKDDVVLPPMRDAIAQALAERPRILFADVYWGEAGLRAGRPNKLLLLVRNLCQQGILYSREAVERHPYVRRLRVQADHLLNIRVTWDDTLAGKVAYLPKPVAWYAATGMSASARDTTFYRVHAAIVRRYLGPMAACAWRCYKALRPDVPRTR